MRMTPQQQRFHEEFLQRERQKHEARMQQMEQRELQRTKKLRPKTRWNFDKIL
jgi:hypothetical protein